jgi:transcriptional regulator with XRE-family HTH domain
MGDHMLSTLLRNKLFPSSNIPHGKHFVAMKGNGSLADYVERVRLEKKMSYGDVANASKGGIGRTHVYRIAKGEVKRPSLEMLKGLAKGLDVPEEELLLIARGNTSKKEFEKSEFYIMYEDFEKLTAQQKRDFMVYFNMAKDGLRRVKGEE